MALLVIVATGSPAGAHSAGPTAQTGEPGRAEAHTELTTVGGDRLTGRALRLDCHGLSFKYLGNSLRVPFDKIATVTSEGEVPVFPGIGKDQIIGKLAVNAGIVAVLTRDLGKVELPITAFRCNGKTTADVASAVNDVPKLNAPARGGGADQQKSTPAEPRRSAGLEPPVGKMAAISGKGPDSAGQNQIDQGSGAAGPSPPPQPDESASPEDGPAARKVNGNPPNGKNNPRNDSSAAPGNQPTPKEQQEESERNMLEFLRNEVVLVQPRKVEADFSVSYLHTNQQIGNERVVIGGAQGRYGFFEGFEGFLAIPYVWGQRQTNELNATVSNELAGIGDVRFGVKYNLIQESQGIPVVVVGASSVAPTGHHPYASPVVTTSSGTALVQGDIRDPLDIQIGTGHWQVIGSVTALKSNDPLVLYATINYSHFIPATYYGVHIVPGDIWELNSGLGFAINDTGTISAQVFVDYVKKWTFNNLSVPQTGITPINLKLSYTHILSPSDLIQPSILFGVTRDATDAVVSLDYIHRF